jgi:hypothetical protein
MTYLTTVALGFDDFAASVILNRNDLCVSAACGLVLSGRDAPLQLHGWQRTFLKVIGHGLDYFWPGHCAGAINGDLTRANSSIQLLMENT